MFTVRVDPTSSEPIFEQVAFQVKEAVARGDLQGGDRLPSVRELARELVVNPNTVVRAYQSLEQDRVIVRRQGAGCFVLDPKPASGEAVASEPLQDLMRRSVTEAYHLGFTAADIKRALARALDDIQFPKKGKKS
ncbi:MAG: GntR family transcriptional regulator [Planctomycetes bacterium]|nr:GntR family transcriptional regulator [Planctomycetota bacterium]